MYHHAQPSVSSLTAPVYVTLDLVNGLCRAWFNTALLTERASALPGLCVLQTGEGQLYEEGLLPEGELPAAGR